jgi:hypothetical protein
MRSPALNFLYYYADADIATATATAKGHWVIGPRVNSPTGGLFVDDPAAIPEHIRAHWDIYTGHSWTTLPSLQIKCADVASANSVPQQRPAGDLDTFLSSLSAGSNGNSR